MQSRTRFKQLCLHLMFCRRKNLAPVSHMSKRYGSKRLPISRAQPPQSEAHHVIVSKAAAVVAWVSWPSSSLASSSVEPPAFDSAASAVEAGPSQEGRKSMPLPLLLSWLNHQSSTMPPPLLVSSTLQSLGCSYGASSTTALTL